MKKSVGYVILGVGIVLIIASYPIVRSSIGITLPSILSDNVLLIAGVALAIIGAVLGFKGKGTKHDIVEVPIYHEKEVVGYRRIKK